MVLSVAKLVGMREGLFVRALSWEEEYRLRHKVRGRDLFVLRRAQIILASARGQRCGEISRLVGCSVSQVRTVIHLFNDQGEACLVRGWHRPKSAAPLLDEGACEALRHLLHQSPRFLGVRAACGVCHVWLRWLIKGGSRRIRWETRRCGALCSVWE